MKIKAVLIAAAAVLCLSACGSTDDSSGAAEGVVTLQTSATTTTTAGTATTTTAATSGTTTTTAKETTTKETTTSEKKTTKETTTTQSEVTTVTEAPVTTTTQAATQPPQTTTTTTTTTAAPTPAGPDLSTLRGKTMVNYKGFVFGVGQNLNDIKSSLGKESAPMQEAPNCLTGETSPMYFYEGMEVETTYAGVITAIRMGSTVMYPGSNVATAAGIKIGDSESALSAFGSPAEQDAYGMKVYKEGSLTVTVFAFDGIIDTIQVADSNS